jgi:hypothetical protein
MRVEPVLSELQVLESGGKKKPRALFRKKVFFRVFELPLLRNAQKTP